MPRNNFFLILIVAFVVSGCASQKVETAPIYSPLDKAAKQTGAPGSADVAAADGAASEGSEGQRSHFTPTDNPKALADISQALEQEGTAPGSDDGQTVVLDDINEDSAAQPYDDLWDRIREGFSLPYDEKQIAGDLNWFANNQAYLERVVERARPYLHFVVSEVEKRNMPLEFALLPVVESAFQPFAYSHGRAAGIWQFIPSTGRLYGLRQNWWYDGRRDIYASTNAALNYLKNLYGEFNDWELVLASYNSGAGTVKRAMLKNQRRGKPTDYWSLRLPPETEGYVPKLLAIAAIVADPEKYGINLQSIPNSPYLARVDLDNQLDLALAADLAGLSVDELYTLNPGFNRWATEPNAKGYLMLPLEKEKQFREQLAVIPPEEHIRWEEHKVKKGETIASIARTYNTTSQVLVQVNKLRGNRLNPGRTLMIPVALKDTTVYTHTEDKRRSEIQNTPRAGRAKEVYAVKAGDTFWSISRSFDVNVMQLAKWNGMSPRDPLAIGQKLVVWVKQAEPEEPAEEVTAAAAEDNAAEDNSEDDAKRESAVDLTRLASPPESVTMRWINYVVRRGDSLARIAARFRVTVAQVKSWNSFLAKRKRLRPGQRIKLYVDVTSQST